MDTTVRKDATTPGADGAVLVSVEVLAALGIRDVSDLGRLARELDKQGKRLEIELVPR